MWLILRSTARSVWCPNNHFTQTQRPIVDRDRWRSQRPKYRCHPVREMQGHLASSWLLQRKAKRIADNIWLPCEIEALSTATATKHFSPYIIQSNTNTCILTDSKPCVQAYEKLCRGEFSASPRVSSFFPRLSACSRPQ